MMASAGRPKSCRCSRPQLLGEPVPENGRLRASALDKPGFGVELNRDHADAPPLHPLRRDLL